MTTTPLHEEGRGKEDLPMAFGKPTQHHPVTALALTELLRSFSGATTAQCYFGPFGLDDDGIPWLVVITQDAKRPRGYQEAGRIGFLAWRWDLAPACPFSLTVMGLKDSSPHARWISASETPVVQAIRSLGWFRVCLAHPTGLRSGWFDAKFKNNTSISFPPPVSALEKLWTFPIPGIPCSKIGKRYQPFSEDELDEENQIPMWPNPIGDIWRTLDGKGPWTDDLDLRDQKTADWASCLFHKRARAAGFIQVIKERQELDGVVSLVDADGRWVADHPSKPEIDSLLSQHPTLRSWIVALAGPSPDAKAAHDAAFATLHTPAAIFAFAAELMSNLKGIVDPDFAQALQFSCEAVLLDSRVTDLGRKRPWLKNIGFSQLQLCWISLDSSCSRTDLQTLWRTGLQFVDLLDAGEWFGPSDLPAPLDIVNKALEVVRVEGSIDEASERVMQLLREAQEARQWSIPWGARVQVQFGPFVAIRIFEKDGEFSCHFLDEQDRYLNVAIGLGLASPRISAVELIRHPEDGGDSIWNDDAEVSLQLIAAAIVRDFLVVEERDCVFKARSMRKRIAGRNVNTIIYLPRVRYNRLRSDNVTSADAGDGARPRHSVTQHLRRAGTASAAQRFLAQRFGVALPSGFTFVRSHERGTKVQEERVQLYRSRSASHMIFEEVAVAPEGTRPAWFEFEKACAQLLEREGMNVIHQAAQRDGDGGADLFAVDADGNSWVVQCKCWAPHRPIGPEIVRELVGAIARADRGAMRSSRGMIVTTTNLTSGAASEAVASGFRIIDGSLFAKLIQGID